MAKLYAKAPDGSDALLSIVITGFTQSLQQNGWCKLPNGLLIQWSGPLTVDFYMTIYLDIEFPIQFSNELFVTSFCDSGTIWNDTAVLGLCVGFTYINNESDNNKMRIYSKIFRNHTTTNEWVQTGYSMYFCIGF